MGRAGRDSGRPCVVILGGGFAGLNAAKSLRRADVDLFVVDQNNYHLFQPLLYQVATAGLSADDIASPIRGLLRRQKNASVMLATVVEIDTDNRMIYMDYGQLRYDYLIVATGMETNYFGQDHWESSAPGLKTLEDALECRRRILTAFEQAERTSEPAEVHGLLTFVVVGAGPTGVELAGAIREIGYQVMTRDFRKIDSSQAKVILIDAGPRVLMGYDEGLASRAQRMLEKMGVEVRLNAMVSDVTAGGLQIGDELIPACTMIWAAGVRATPVAKFLNTPLDRFGRAIVGSDLTIPGHDDVFVVGDLAHFKEDDSEEALPGIAPVAIQQGHWVAHNIRRRLEGRTYLPFRYRDKGKMATIGRAKAVAEIRGFKFAGYFAWLLWLVVHLLFLVGFRNRLMVVFDWAYAYIGMRRSARLIIDVEGGEEGGLPGMSGSRGERTVINRPELPREA